MQSTSSAKEEEDTYVALQNERRRAGQFKTNFLLLKSELSRKDQEVQRLRLDRDKSNKENRALIGRLQSDVASKDAFISQLTQKLETVLEDNLLASQIQESFERRCNSKLVVTQNALEEAQNALRHLHLQTDSLMKAVAETQERSQVDKKILFTTVQAKKLSLEKDKVHLTKQLKKLKATWSRKKDQWRKEITLMRTAFTNLQQEADLVLEEKIKLTTQLETLRLSHTQQEREWKAEHRRLEVENGNLRRQLESLESNYQSLQEHGKELERQVQQMSKELVLAKGQLEEALGQHKRQLDVLVLNHAQEISCMETDKANLNQLCQELQRKLESEAQSCQHVSSKLLMREKELNISIDRYQKAELEFLRKLEHERRDLDSKLQESKQEIVGCNQKLGGMEERLRLTCEQLERTRQEYESVKNTFELLKKECTDLRAEKTALASTAHNVERLTSQQREMEERHEKEHAEFNLLKTKNQQYAKLIWKLRKRLQEVELQVISMPPSDVDEIVAYTKAKDQS